MKAKIILVSTLLLLSFTHVHSQSGKEIKEALKAAKEHLKYEEYLQAIPYLEKLNQNEPENAKYSYWLGKCLYLNYEKKRALPYLAKASEINPEVDDELHLYHALALHYSEKYNEAIRAYRTDLERYEAGSEQYRWIMNRIAQCNYGKQQSPNVGSDEVKVENAGAQINTQYSEHSPVISANDSVLVFTARRPESLGALPEQNFYDEDIFVARKQGESWSKAENIGKPVNSKGHDATISMSVDGKRIYIYRHKNNGGLFVTDFDPEVKKWREPKNLGKPFNSKYYETSVCQSPDSSVLYFSSDRPGGYGGKDIYMSRKEGNKWLDPVNLGPTVNTPFDEDAPYIHPDGIRLYFSSNGPKSMGGYDIFVTEYDSNIGNWLEPLNLGQPINTADDDIYFVLAENGLTGYYSSGKEGGYGEKDIYQINFPFYPYPKRNFVVELAGIVQDVQTLDTLPAVIRLVDASTNTILDSTTTKNSLKYNFILQPERAYSIVVQSEGYEPVTTEIVSPSITRKDILIERNMMLDRKEKEKEKEKDWTEALPEIQNIYFDFDQSNIRETEIAEINRIVNTLEKNQALSVKLAGHTDWYGNYQYNLKLSQKRVEAVRKALIEEGINPNAISTTYFSENAPIESNQNDEGRQFNRRVELIFIAEGEEVYRSLKLRQGITSIPVDHTKPKGRAGFDQPGAIASSNTLSEKESSTGNNMENNWNELEPSVPLPANSSSPTGTDEQEPLKLMLANLNIHHIYFDFDKHNLRATAINELDKLLSIGKADPQVQIQIIGHTDNWGSVSYNQTLSENRATAAYKYLQERGLGLSQLELSGFSELQPMDSNNNAGGRQNNRRVEFRVLKNGVVLYSSIP